MFVIHFTSSVSLKHIAIRAASTRAILTLHNPFFISFPIRIFQYIAPFHSHVSKQTLPIQFFLFSDEFIK